jgi:hypothetical protein
MNVQRLFVIGIVLLVAGASNASVVVPITPFTGQYSEGFESLHPVGGYPTPMTILGGHGTFDDTVAHYCQLAISLWSASTGAYIYPYQGSLMMGSVTGWAAFTTTEPMSQIGFYMGTSDIPWNSSITFRGAGGVVIDSFPLTIPSGPWKWYGWQSSVPFTNVEVHCTPNPGVPLVFDNLQVSFVPEPASLCLLALGAALLVRRWR